MVGSTGMRGHWTELGVLDTTRISGSSCSLTVIGLTDNFLIHDATDLRWNERTRISGEIGSKPVRANIAGRGFIIPDFAPSREGCLLPGEHRLAPRSATLCLRMEKKEQ